MSDDPNRPGAPDPAAAPGRPEVPGPAVQAAAGAAAPRLPVLYVDDEPDNLALFELHFAEELDVTTAPGGQEALSLLARRDFGVVVTDERMPGMSGVELLAQVVARFPDTVRVIVSAYSDSARLLRAINLGHAHEYLVKPWDRDELLGCLERALVMAERRRRLSQAAALSEALAQDLHRQADPRALVGGSGGLRQVLEAARRAAQSDAPVLLRGETGVGKGLVARYIHDGSVRAGGPFVGLSCAAFTADALEGELFGQEGGAGAGRARRGRLELAAGGTLFLDEVADLPPRAQAGLLRALQERVVEPAGGGRPVPADVRVIAATHEDPERLVREGRLRAELYYRLNVLPLQVPPLRERAGDIPALLQHFLDKHGRPGQARRVSQEALQALCAYSWPGNVRELENLVQRALILSAGGAPGEEAGELDVEDFCLQLRPRFADEARDRAQQDEAERLRRLLLTHGGNCARAARELGVPRTTFISRAKKHGLL